MVRKLLRRLGTALLVALVALCFAPTLVPPFLDRIYYEGPASDHFDGRHFFNPDLAVRGRLDPQFFLNRWLDGSRAVWPDHVPVRPTAPPPRVAGNEMVVTWIGHATVLVQTAGLNILTDPIWSDRASPFSFAGPVRVRAPGVRFEDLPRIDLVLISHNHYDHLDLPTLRRLWERDRPAIVTSLGNDTILRGAGIESVALDWGQVFAPGRPDGGPQFTSECAGDGTWCHSPYQVLALRNHHWGSRWGADRNRALWSAFAIRTPSGNIFFAGDTGWGDGSWAREAARLGPYRLALLPIGAYRPQEMMRENHINPQEAYRVFQILNPVRAFGIHWGTFQLSFEGVDDPVREIAALDRGRGRFVVTEPGVSFRVPER